MAAGHLTRSAAILAGGQATRFDGRDKSRLLVDGHTILDRQLGAIAPLTDDVMIIGDRDEALNGGISAAGVQARVIRDIVPGCGPLGGLHAALAAAQGDALFLTACDMPYLTTAFIAYLLSLAGEADVVVPETERGYHPLCAVYSRACLGPAEARLGERRLRMRDLVDVMRARVVTVEEIGRFGDPLRILANVNTPADFAGLETLQGHKL